MTPTEFRLAARLFEEISELPEADQARALDAACGSDARLRSELERMLAADRLLSTDEFLKRSALEDAAALIPATRPKIPTPGTVIAGYRLGARIGAGGMGVVFEAQDLRLDRRVAVKILPQGSPVDASEGLPRFRREARAASLLNHPNIVSIYDAGFEGDWGYIATEFVEGKTLRQIISSGIQWETTAILDVISQTASALAAAHRAGIVHRDIKPENIMVRDDGFVKVLDFGLARLREPDSSEERPAEFRTRPGSVAGTLRYLSPEQVNGGTASPRSDLFSLGVVAYELATGTRPFEGPTDGAVFDAILRVTPRQPSTVRPALDPQVDSLILRLLEKDPQLRFQTAEDLQSSCRWLTRAYITQALEEAQASRQPETGRAGRPRRDGMRRPWLSAAAATIAAAAGLAFWMLWPGAASRAGNIVRITNSGVTVDSFATDGDRVYYAAAGGMFQVSSRGGEPVRMPQLSGMVPLDVSPDRTQILLREYPVSGFAVRPLWVASTLDGKPRRLGDLSAGLARWSPDGDRIVYTNGRELRTARSDGSESRAVTRLNTVLVHAEWARGGRAIRFGTADTLWEVAPDATGLRQVPLTWNWGQWGATLSPRGSWFLYTAGERRRDLWALHERGFVFPGSKPQPERLTSGPLDISFPRMSPDGRRIFFRGGLDRGELVRYEAKSGQWKPYLDGLPGMQLDYSRDGKWIAWVSFPEGTVWRGAAHGGDRLQLTSPPVFARNPRWSPDGSTIVFYGGVPGQPEHVYLVPAAGGAVRQLTNGEAGPGGDADGNWLPDGNSVVFGAQHGDQLANQPQGLPLRRIDLRSGQITALEGSEGLWGPRCSPDGRYVAALGSPEAMLWVYDLATRRRTQLTSKPAGWPKWSRDGRYVYYRDSAAYRVRLSDRKIERLTDLTGLNLAGLSLGWVGPAPDGSLIASRDAGSTEVYAFDWDATAAP